MNNSQAKVRGKGREGCLTGKASIMEGKEKISQDVGQIVATLTIVN